MLGGTDGEAAEVAIRTGIFCNKEHTSVWADIIGEQVAGSLRELQEEVEVLEETIHDTVFIMGQREEQRRRG